MKGTWSNDDEKFLLSNWSIMPLDAICVVLDRSESGVTSKARRLGIDVKKPIANHKKKKWTEAEDITVTKFYGKLDIEEYIHLLPDRTAVGISKRAKVLGLTEPCIRWTEEDEDFLHEKWGHKSVEQIAMNLGRTRDAILLKAHAMGLREQVSANGDFLTPREVSQLVGANIRTVYGWIETTKLEYRKLRIGDKKKYQISISHLTQFLEKYQDLWCAEKSDISFIKSCFSSFIITTKENINIYDMPFWLLEKIEKDKAKDYELRDWTLGELNKMMTMKEKGATYAEIALSLDRSYEAVKTKIHIVKKENIQFNYAQSTSVAF